MLTKPTALACAMALSAFGAPALAHFQLIHTETTQLEVTGDVPVKLIFWHPHENGHVMDMDTPLEFFVQHRGEKIDLMPSLTPMTFQGADNAGAGFDAIVPVKRSGDYVLAVTPAPYYEESENLYIQQITKTYLNRNELPTDWMEPLGLPTEILPLVKPTNVMAGSTFSGQVVANGLPVPGVEIEIEYLAAVPDMANNTPGPVTASPLPGGSIVAISGPDGVFSFGIPRAGMWGFAALGSGPETEFDGKDLSQDAVIWIRAYDFD